MSPRSDQMSNIVTSNTIMFLDVVEAQGWSEATVLMLIARFLEDKDLMGKFEEYLEEAAEEENTESE